MAMEDGISLIDQVQGRADDRRHRQGAPYGPLLKGPSQGFTM